MEVGMIDNMSRKVKINDLMQRGYEYELVEEEGQGFDESFEPDLSPKQMLKLGVFGGVYMRDCKDEFGDWFDEAKLAEGKRDESLNFFEVEASQSLSVWREKGWINEEHDPRGWFQWYCRYYKGRRLPQEDERQIKRWRAFKRHWAQVEKNCLKGDWDCRRKQRQALLHWASDSRKI